jgi:hypothetical protein
MNGPTAKLLFSSRCSAPADEPQRLSRPDIRDDGHRRALRSTRSRPRTAPSSPRAPPMPTPASCGSRACAPGAGRATAHVRLAFYCLMEPRAPAGCSAPSSTGAGRAAIPGAPSSAPGLLAAHGRSSSLTRTDARRRCCCFWAAASCLAGPRLGQLRDRPCEDHPAVARRPEGAASGQGRGCAGRAVAAVADRPATGVPTGDRVDVPSVDTP